MAIVIVASIGFISDMDRQLMGFATLKNIHFNEPVASGTFLHQPAEEIATKHIF